jgi:outer membrane receptor protein involved in Fe transport
MMRSISANLRGSLPLVLLLAISALAAVNATLTGRVADANGAAIPGAKIEATNTATGSVVTVTTNDEGLYVIPQLAPGTYRVTAQKSGFRTSAKQEVIIHVGGNVTEDFSLSPGALEETVTVEGRETLIEKDSPAVGALVDRQSVENLPLNGRSFQSLIELAPGVVLAKPNINSPGQFSVNGQRTNANIFIVDGVSANVAASTSAQGYQQAGGTLPGLTVLGGTNSLVSIDALEEFRIQTSTYAPEYGRSPGAQISLTTRSGKNKIAGGAFDYFRNEALDANDWFANRDGIKRLPLRQNQFGGFLGGPIVLPKKLFGPLGYDGHDRTFFFFSYEGLRLKQPQFGTRFWIVPSREIRQTATGAIRDVLNAFPFPNAAAQPGDPANTGRYFLTVSLPSQFDAVSTRVDHRFGMRLNVFGRYNWSPSSNTSRAFASQNNQFDLDTETFTAGATWTISPRMINDLRGNWSRSEGRFEFVGLPIDGAVLPPDALVFPPNVSRENTSVSLNIISASSFVTSLTQGRSLGNDQRQFNLVDTFTLVAGNHELKFGGDYRRLTPRAAARSLGYSYSFYNAAAGTFRTDGLAQSLQVQALAPVNDFRFHNFSTFAQDTWRLNKRLTLTYGLRWDVNPPPSSDILPYAINGLDNPLMATLAPPNTRQWETQYNNFAPRVGFSYQLPDSWGMVVRGGFGLFYDLGTGTALRGYSSFPFNSARTTMNLSFPAPAAALEPLPFNTAPPYSAQFYVFDRNLELPETRQWNLAIEKSLGRSQTVTASYVGALGRDLLRTTLLRNQLANAAQGIPAITLLNPALFSTTSMVFLTRSEANSDYHALQLQFQRRLARGFSALASYTWSKAIDDVSDETIAGLPTTGLPGFPVDAKLERGPANFDVRHNFIGSLSYDLPVYGANAMMKRLVGGWGVDAIVRLRSATPVNVVSTTADPLNITTNVRRPDLVPGVPVYLDDPTAPGGRRINRDAFVEATRGRQGTLGRNALRAFGVQQYDFSLRREFGLSERFRLQFRAEFFNLFNHPNFGDPISTINSPALTFGRPQQMLNRTLGPGGTNGGLDSRYQVGGPRSVQFALKLLY